MKDRVILDLCGGTGSWSRPYVEAGYDVRVVSYPDNDIRCYAPPVNVYGVLAAPPCTHFSSVRNTAREPRNLRIAMDTVEHCLRIIWECQFNKKLAFWALENPASGMIKRFLGKPAAIFCPSDFGHDYTKKTALWGNFNNPKPTEKIAAQKSLAMTSGYFKELPASFIRDPFMRKDAIHRSITPEGFAEAFFLANR